MKQLLLGSGNGQLCCLTVNTKKGAQGRKAYLSLLLFTQQSCRKQMGVQSCCPSEILGKTTYVQSNPTITNRLHCYRVHRQLKTTTFSNRDCRSSKDILESGLLVCFGLFFVKAILLVNFSVNLPLNSPKLARQ